MVLNWVFTYPYTPPALHPTPWASAPPPPTPHIKGHQSPTVQGERQIFREGLSPHKSVVGEKERTWYPPYSSKPPPPPPAPKSLSSPTSWRREEALGGDRNRRGREKEVCGNTSEEDDRDWETPSHTQSRHAQLVSQTKTHLHTQRKSSHTHTQHGHMDTVVGHLFSAFDLLQLSVPLEWGSRISASIYVLFHLKTIQLAVIKKGTLHWQVRVGRSLGE